MKLLDILARELESWPEPNDHAWQDYSKEVRFNRTTRADFYVGELCEDHIRNINELNPKTGVTRSDWEQARAQLKGEAKMPKAAKDGWIRWRGGRCPVDANSAIEYRMRCGNVMHTATGALLSWEHGGWASDIMAYRLHKPENEPKAGKLVTDDAVLKFGFTGEGEAEMPAAKYFQEGPLQWRDRIREIDTTTAALTQERASLVERLAGEGFALIERDEPNEAVESAQAEDMSDPANWKVGDMVVSLEEEEDISKCGFYRLTAIHGEDVLFRDNAGDHRNRCASDYKWHSRPTT